MARCHFRYIVQDAQGNAIQNARVNLYQAGTTTPVTDAWSAATAGTSVTSLVSNGQGEVECWFDSPQEVDAEVTDNSDAAFYPVGLQAVAVDLDAGFVALDSAVVHKAGTEPVTGLKDFTGGLTKNGVAVETTTGAQVKVDAETTRATAAEATKAQALVPTAVKTANYTAAAGDFVLVDTTSGALTITLPTAPADKTRVGVKHIIQGGTNTVSVVCAGTDVFNKTGGDTTLLLSLVNQALNLQYIAASHVWVVVADDIPLGSTDQRMVALRPGPLLTTYTRADLTTVAWTGIDPATLKMYGVVIANGHFATSTDAGSTFVDQSFSPVTYFGAGSVTEFVFSTSYMYVIHSSGTLWRAPKDTFNNWTNISVPQRPAATIGRTGTLSISGDGAVLLACNYNSSPPTPEGAYAYRSTDNGATWTTVLSLPNAKHSHAIRIDPYHPTHVYYSVGDGGFPDIGLYRSKDLGITWALVSAAGGNRYGIDMVFPPPVVGAPEMVVLEGDGFHEPLLLLYRKDSNVIEPAIWFQFPPGDPNSTVATSRGIALTTHGDVVFMTTTEAGAVGSKAGIYVAAGPWFNHAVLLQDVTGSEPVGFLRSIVTGGYVINRLIKFNEPQFAK